MGVREAKKIYNALLETDDLFTMYAKMSGTWEKDKDKFLKQYYENEELIKAASNITIDDDDELEG